MLSYLIGNMDHYQTLGIPTNSDQSDIKRAYRKLASKYHPDKSTGNTEQFQRIQEAYSVLGDEATRASYDLTLTASSSNSFDEILTECCPIIRKRNKDLTVEVSISLRQSFTGDTIDVSYATTRQSKRTVVVSIPAGIVTGSVFQFTEMGDDAYPNVPNGNLNVVIIVLLNAPNFIRKDNDLITFATISVFDAMVGATCKIANIVGELTDVVIKPGTQTNTEVVIKNGGFPGFRQGNFVIVFTVFIPTVIDPILVNQINELQFAVENSYLPH